MKFFIDSHALKRLGDPDLAIRQRSLNELSCILKNNILFEAENHLANEELQVINLDELTRQLIRWFQFKPISNEDEVLDLLILILSRKDFLKHITRTISVSRLKKEMLKIAKMLLPENISIKLQTLNQLLSNFEAAPTPSEAGSFESVATSTKKQAKDDTLIDRMQRLLLRSPVHSQHGSTECDEEEEIFINEISISLTGADLEIFYAIDAELLMYKDEGNFRNALEFLHASIEDFPPEYFLQIPNMLETFFDIIWKVSQKDAISILRLIRFILNGLKDRWIESENQHACFISVKKHMNKILQIFTDFFEHFHDQFSSVALVQQQELLNETYLILFDLADFVRETQDVCEIYLNELLNMMGKVARNFRLSNASQEESCRLNYLVCIYAINIFIGSTDTVNISKYCVNNVWEYELDVALLDTSLKCLHEDIYNLIMENRLHVVKEDKDLSLLLNIETLWTPMVQIWKCWENMTEKEIIFKGLEALDVIRIHKNPEFVNVIFNAIEKTSHRFHAYQKLKEAAEDLFLRLISIDVPEIRARIYSLARERVQMKISEDCNDSSFKDIDVCAVLGIPLSPEIFTEILCYGFMDTDVDIQKNVRLILFAILRAKVIFPNHWLNILNLIKPVLAMLPSIFSKEPKLGFLALDIFNKNSGFTKDELSQAFARFLFSPHHNAREFAKRKLLENFNDDEYSYDFIEIVPENFCILTESQIGELQIPDGKLGYDPESYLTTTQLLKTTSTHNDPDVIQSILLQLSVLMNSKKLCIKAHDDNLWVYFMGSLDMNFPNHAIIRKLTINILFKWVICIPSFRIYLSNELKVLQFLISTLIYYQDDVQIKKHASSLLFLLLFSDFIVTNEKVTSLPSILSTLECPFRFTQHWVESPFNKISQLEWLHESMYEDNDDNDSNPHGSDIKQITQKYLRFTFAESWFDDISIQNQSYYQDCSENALKVPEKLVLTESDYKFFKTTALDHFVNDSCKALENATTTDQISELTQQVICILMLPKVNVQKLAILLEERIRKYGYYKSHQLNSRKLLFIKYLELYQHILPLINDNQIISMIKGDSIISALLKSEMHTNDDFYVQILRVLNGILKLCSSRFHLTHRIIKNFNDEVKLNFTSRAVEKLIGNMQENFIKTRAFNDTNKIPILKVLLASIRNILNNFTVVLDEPFINETFSSILNATKYFLTSSSKNAKKDLRANELNNSHVLDQLFAIIESMSSLAFKINLKSDDYNTLFLWLTDKEKRNKILIWKIVAQLTKRSIHFTDFCKGFESALNISFYDVLMKCICNSNQPILERNGQALILGNCLDFMPKEVKINAKNNEEIKSDLIKTFIRQKHNSIDAVSFIVKKMISNNMPEVTSVARDTRIIEKILQSGVHNLDVIAVCYKYGDLEKHVVEAVEKISDEKFSSLLSQMLNPFDGCKITPYQRSVNKSVLDIILILLQSSRGYEKIHSNIFKNLEALNKMVIIISCGLKENNNHNETAFYLEILLAFLNSPNKNAIQIFTNQVYTLLKSEYLLKMSAKSETELHKTRNVVNYKHVQYAVDLILMRILALFNDVDTLKLSDDIKYDIKAFAFIVVKKLLACSEQGRLFSSKLNLLEMLGSKILVSISTIGDKTVSVTTKKDGVHKCQLRTKEMCIYIRAITEWNLQLNEGANKVKEILLSLIKVYNWIESDSVLMNTFTNFLRETCSIEIVAKNCVIQEYNGKSFMTVILKKAQSISAKHPHTEANLVLLKNLLDLFIAYAHMVEIRLLLKNSKILQMLEIFHPQIHKNRKTSWNDVTLTWMRFFEKLSQFEDIDCKPEQISLLCRLIRTGDERIGNVALKTIRNFSMKSSIGYVVLLSKDFLETVNTILSSDYKNSPEKMLILQTLLSIAATSDQMRSKMKNSSLNRKLKDQLSALQLTDGEHIQVYNLITMLSDILYT